MNTAIISGRLVRNPGYNETQNEKGLHKIAKFVLAVRRNYSDEVSFIPVKAFAKKAEFVRDYLVQGTRVLVEGEIITGSYECKDTGKKIYTTESGELTVCVRNNNMALTSRLTCDPKGNIRKSLVSTVTNFHTLNIPTDNLVVDGMCFIC